MPDAVAPPMQYTQQHAAAGLIPAPTDIEHATRAPDSLLSFLNLFRDAEIPEDADETVIEREATVEDFYMVDSPDDVKNNAIHVSTVLFALSTNANAGYQAHHTYGDAMRNSILFRASLVFEYALPSMGNEITRAKRAFNNYNTASSVFADMQDPDQIRAVLVAKRDALTANLGAQLATADNELHASTIRNSNLLKSILDSDTFQDSQEMLRDVCSYLANRFALTFAVAGNDPDIMLTEMLNLAGFKASDTPFPSDKPKFDCVHTIAVRLMVRQRKLFKEHKVAYPRVSKPVSQLSDVYRCKHVGEPIDRNHDARLLASAFSHSRTR